MKQLIYLAMLVVLISSCYAVDDLYNMTALDNSDNFYEYTVALNTLSSYAIGYGLLIIIFSIAFMVNYGNTGTIWGGLASGSFIGMLSATIFLPLGLIPFVSYEYVMVIGIVSLVVIIWFARG